MRKFVFGLQKLLDYRQTKEDILLAELAAAEAEYARESEALATAMADRDRGCARMKECLDTGSPQDIKECHDYLDSLTEQVSHHEWLLQKAAEKKAMKVLEVVDAAKDRKVLERLRQRKVVEHRKENDRQEQKFLDDLGSIRHARSNGGSE